MEVNDFNSFQQFLRENNVFNRFGLEQIGVFGSFVRGEEYNDIDLLLDDYLKFDQRMALKDFIEKRSVEPVETSVDIVIKDFAEPIILYRALKEIKYASPS